MSKNSKFLAVFFALTIIPAAITFTGCDNIKKPDSPMKVSEFFAMDTYMTISAYGEDAEMALSAVRKEIKGLEALLSVTDPNSEVSRINQNSGNGESISPYTSEIIQAALDIGKKTDGALDITLYPIIKEWGFTTGEYQIPQNDKIAQLLTKTGYDKIQLEGNRLLIPKDFKIDLGALAKGYSSEQAKKLLTEKGITSAIINLGGNVQLLGGKPDGSPWSIGIQNPFGDGYSCTVKAKDKAIVTSGNYQRFFEQDGVRYCHIFDSKTGKPVQNGLASVTVISENGLICDGLSTALFAMGEDRAITYWKKQGGFEMIIINENGEVKATEGIYKDCQGNIVKINK